MPKSEDLLVIVCVICLQSVPCQKVADYAETFSAFVKAADQLAKFTQDNPAILDIVKSTFTNLFKANQTSPGIIEPIANVTLINKRIMEEKIDKANVITRI
jgi:hypothetical protein